MMVMVVTRMLGEGETDIPVLLWQLWKLGELVHLTFTSILEGEAVCIHFPGE
jgi:hypothetical protein